jgi:uncharacterized protein (DUF2336 family)
MTSSALLAEIEGAVKTGSPQRRVEMLERVVDLFLSAAGRMDESQIAVFDDIVVRLIARTEPRALARLSATLAAAGVFPANVVGRLAYHDDASVAVPVLAKFHGLSDDDLVRIANARSRLHLLAISGRERLNERVTDVALRRGDSLVFHALANNTGARFSELGYAVLIAATEGDETLAHKLGLRRDIPANLLRELLSKAPAVVCARLLKVASVEARLRIERAIQAIEGAGHDQDIRANNRAGLG